MPHISNTPKPKTYSYETTRFRDDTPRRVCYPAFRLLFGFGPGPDFGSSVINYFQTIGKTPQEKLYLHLDKPYYGAGEEIWFRGYLLNAITHMDNSPSNYIYVELTDRGDSVLQRFKFRRDSLGFREASRCRPTCRPESIT